jgi:hypothetical protein
VKLALLKRKEKNKKAGLLASSLLINNSKTNHYQLHLAEGVLIQSFKKESNKTKEI